MKIFIKYFTTGFTATFTATIAAIALIAAISGGGNVTPIGKDGVYIKGSGCTINMESRHTDEYGLRLIFNKCLSAHRDYLSARGE